mmetsp:Transcript_1798/g.3435  ORF Transcript_1798/g.3435 Transcript_1798/m.3435 type:complete len:83 (+) Transcript_1798:79-327(+)
MNIPTLGTNPKMHVNTQVDNNLSQPRSTFVHIMLVYSMDIKMFHLAMTSVPSITLGHKKTPDDSSSPPSSPGCSSSSACAFQ